MAVRRRYGDRRPSPFPPCPGRSCSFPLSFGSSFLRLRYFRLPQVLSLSLLTFLTCCFLVPWRVQGEVGFSFYQEKKDCKFAEVGLGGEGDICFCCFVLSQSAFLFQPTCIFGEGCGIPVPRHFH